MIHRILLTHKSFESLIRVHLLYRRRFTRHHHGRRKPVNDQVRLLASQIKTLVLEMWWNNFNLLIGFIQLWPQESEVLVSISSCPLKTGPMISCAEASACLIEAISQVPSDPPFDLIHFLLLNLFML